MSYFYYGDTKITHEEFNAIPVIDGYRTLPNGTTIHETAVIGDGVRIGDYGSIGNRVRIGDGVCIGVYVSIGDYTIILSGFASLSLTDKWMANPYQVGKFRRGCSKSGDANYEKDRNRQYGNHHRRRDRHGKRRGIRQECGRGA